MSSPRLEELAARAKTLIDEIVKLRKEVDSSQEAIERFDRVNQMYRKVNELISIIYQICMV